MLAAQLFLVLTASLAAAAAAQAQPTPQAPATPAAVVTVSGYVPERVFDTRTGAFSDFELMLADLAKADVVLVGEQHDDPNTHRLETAVLEGLARRGRSVIVSLEMFERDAQEPLEHF